MAVDGSDVRMVLAGDTSPTTPAWSPDGSRIAFLEKDRDFEPDDLSMLRLSTSAPDGSDLRVIARGLIEPMFPTVSWSPDGTSIAVLDSRAHDLSAFDDYGIPLTEIAVYALDGTRDRFVDVPGTAHGFTWWPDGQGFAVAASDTRGDVDLVRVDLEGQVLGHLAEDVAPYPPAVSPGGDLVAFVRQGPPIGGSHVPVDDVWTVRPDGSDLTRVTDESGLKPALAWSRDGTRIVFASQTPDRCDIVSISPDGSDRTLVADRSTMGGCADEISVNGSIPPPARPEPDVVTEAGHDIGLGFNLCHAERLGGIDFLGDGTRGQAWIGAPPKEDGTCTEFAKSGKFMVAVDHTGDQLADSWIDLPWQCSNGCALADATDLDANGSEELIVQGYFSIMDYWVLAVRPNDADEMVLEPILVASPGHDPASIAAGEPLRIDAGGDAGYSSVVWCDGYPDDPVIVWAWVYGQVETEQPKEVHITRLQLQPDGLMHVIGTNDYSIPASEDWGYGDVSEPACGVDWDFWR